MGQNNRNLHRNIYFRHPLSPVFYRDLLHTERLDGLPGDKVLVNKLVYGPKLPVSPYDIPWVNLVWFLQAGASANPDSVYWDYRRLPGFSAIKRSDVMVFSHPLWGGRNNFFIKRCMALPGDTLAIEGGKVTINGQLLPEPACTKKVYEIWPDTSRQFSLLADSLRYCLTVFMTKRCTRYVRS